MLKLHIVFGFIKVPLVTGADMQPRRERAPAAGFKNQTPTWEQLVLVGPRQAPHSVGFGLTAHREPPLPGPVENAAPLECGL
jgi:hypothetical protein